MKIIDYPSPNYFVGDNKIEAICLHGTDGPLQASLDTLTNPRRDNPDLAVSSNYLIDKDGTIYRLVSWWRNHRAYGNGIVRLPDRNIKWLIKAIAERVNPNFITVSIEHVASYDEMVSGASMPDAQFNSSTRLVNKLLKDLQLPISDQTVIGHRQINSVDKPFCPGVINIPAYIEVLKLRA